MSVVEVNPNGDRARKARRILGRSVGKALDEHGDDLAGFALVTWDMRGGCETAYLSGIGMVSETLVPSFVGDALNRHVAVVISTRATASRTDGE